MRVALSVVLVASLACAGSRAESWHRKGMELSNAGKHREAIEAYGKAIALDPEMANAHFNMGLNYMRLRMPDQAATCFRRVLEINPADVEASRHLTLAQAAIQARAESFR